MPAMLPAIRADYTKYPLRTGVSNVSFNTQGTLVSIRLESSPNVVHIHSFYSDAFSQVPDLHHIASLVFTHPIKMATWSKGKASRLAIATRTGAVYIWDGETGWVEDGEEVSGGMMEGIGIPTSQSRLFYPSEILKLMSRNRLLSTRSPLFPRWFVVSHTR